MQDAAFAQRVSWAKSLARGRWKAILLAAGVSEELLAKQNKPCPACGGTDRFSFLDRDGDGTYFCRGCGGGRCGAPRPARGVLLSAGENACARRRPLRRGPFERGAEGLPAPRRILKERGAAGSRRRPVRSAGKGNGCAGPGGLFRRGGIRTAQGGTNGRSRAHGACGNGALPQKQTGYGVRPVRLCKRVRV